MSPGEKQVSVSARHTKSQFTSVIPTPCTRREFAKRSFAVLPGVCLLNAVNRVGAAETPARPGKPNSKFAGVQVGLNVPYSFANGSMSGDDILKNCLQLGLSAVELRTQPVEAFLGAPKANAEKRDWRKSVSTDRVKEFRKKYETCLLYTSPSPRDS